MKKSKNNASSGAGGSAVALIRLEGSISSNGPLEYFTTNALLEGAFSHPDIDAVALHINSPGGSPTQSEMIANRIRQLSKQFNKPVYAFVGDAAASGGYWIACGADEIYANKTSTIGSIGVVTEYQNVHDKLEKEGVKRGFITAGKKKRKNSPYDKFDESALKEIQKSLNKMHAMFIDWVMERRGDKLDKASINSKNLGESELFSGETWFGEDAEKLGLIDGVADMHTVLEQKFGADVNLLEFKFVVHNGQQGGPQMETSPLSYRQPMRKPANDSHEPETSAPRKRFPLRLKL